MLDTESPTPTLQQEHARLATLEEKIDALYVSSERTRKYFLISLIVNLIFFVLPLIGIVFAVPLFLHSYTSGFDIQNIEGL